MEDFRTNTYDAETKTVTYSDAQADVYDRLVEHYHDFFSEPEGGQGLRPAAIADPEATRQLTAYFSWSAWVAAAERPGKDYSYTNNWPPEELVDNGPTADVVVWSVLSLIALLAGIGALLAVFGRWNWLGWHGRDQHELSFRAPDRVALTPSQKATAGFFLAMAAMFLVQSLVGVASHPRCSPPPDHLLSAQPTPSRIGPTPRYPCSTSG